MATQNFRVLMEVGNSRLIEIVKNGGSVLTQESEYYLVNWSVLKKCFSKKDIAANKIHPCVARILMEEKDNGFIH